MKKSKICRYAKHSKNEIDSDILPKLLNDSFKTFSKLWKKGKLVYLRLICQVMPIIWSRRNIFFLNYTKKTQIPSYRVV